MLRVALLISAAGLWCVGAPPAEPLRSVKVIVETDSGIVAGLSQEHFELYEGNRRRPILFFDSRPASSRIVLLLDFSGSILFPTGVAHKSPEPSRLAWMNSWVDELAVLAFSAEVRPVKEFGSPIPSPISADLFDLPSQRTALYDAVLTALDMLSNQVDAPNRVLLALSDGEDNASRNRLSRVGSRLREAGARVYALTGEGDLGYGRVHLRSWARETGGQFITLRHLAALLAREPDRLAPLVAQILRELEFQYTLAYHPLTGRKVDVRLTGHELEERPVFRVVVMPEDNVDQ